MSSKKPHPVVAAACVAAVSFLAFAGEVSFKEGAITLPTYAPGGYDKTPLFYTGRVYQGAQGRVYPYPMQDVLYDGRVDETYKYLTLENEWLQTGLLPEHGGHLLNFTDKATGFEAFYRQHVIKPALIGMLGAWISGGVEWNFPHHHRATTAMPIDWRAVSNGDGSKTVWIGETELRRRLKWTIGLSLLPDRAVLKAENVFMNRQPWIETMIYWANVSVHCGEDYQIQFPPSMHLGFDHHKNYWTSYPIGPRKEEVELLPSQRSKYADDISGMMDLSWWKNFTIESRSIFGMDPDNSFMAGYDHGRNCGTAHFSNRHITVGKKFFLWGNFPEAHVWDKVLTDNDGPYLELMVGCWSDNQPDYSWIAPYETRRVEQFWFPVKGIGGIKNVTIDGAVNVDRLKSGELLVGFHSTRVLKGCTVMVARTSSGAGSSRDSRIVFSEKNVSIDPNTPWCRAVKVEPGAADQEFTASIADASGRVFLSYTPVGPDPHDPLPPKVANPKPPHEYMSAELAYETGLRLDQFQNGILDPEPYYRRALEIDPDYSRANLAMGVRLAKNGSYAAAKPYLEKAVARATQNHTRALDASPEYYLALVERHMGNLRRAEDLFWRCTWRATSKKESFVEIARICCLQGRYDEAHDVLEYSAMPIGMQEAKIHTLHAYIHRKLKDHGNATEAQRSKWLELASKNQKMAFECDPLEYWGVCEGAFASAGTASAAAAAAGLAAAEKNRGLKAQQLLECLSDYFGVGAWEEIVALCDAALAKAAAEKPYATEGALPLKDTIAACDSYRNALFGYFKAYAQAKLGVDGDVVSKTLTAAGLMTPDYCFPSRLEELAVLQWAAEGQTYGDKNALASTHYYLGEVLWNMDQKDAALASWQAAARLNPRHALALRCIGFALSHPGTYFTNTGVPSGIASREAYDYYIKSLEADPGSFRTLDEAGKLAEKLRLPAAERLALMEKYKGTVYKYDPCVLRLAYTYNAVGRYAEAHEILTTRRFHVWEGADGLLAPFVESCLGLGRELMARGDYKAALKYFEESTTYPENLQAGRPGDAGTEPKSRYFMAQCKKALGDEAGWRAELENSLRGWIHAGEMDYWRVKALKELGRDAECAPLIAELQQAIRELETPQPEVINAYAKFAGDNSAMERAAKAREKAGALRALLDELVQKDARPAAGGAPRINGPTIYGVRPRSPIIYRLPVTGTRPLALSARGLPEGVTFDAEKGILGGSTTARGTNVIEFSASNAEGSATKMFRLVVGDAIALTPPMGFNTFGGLGGGEMMNEVNVRKSVRALIDKGLVDHGYAYCNIDDGWQGVRGGTLNAIQPNKKFGDMKKLFDDMHAEGLKAGIYSTPWGSSFQSLQGASSIHPDGRWDGGKRLEKYLFDVQDARQFVEWGCDYFKYDWSMRAKPNQPGLPHIYYAGRIAAAFAAQERDVVVELSNSTPFNEAWNFTEIGNMTRTGADLIDIWSQACPPSTGKVPDWAMGIVETMVDMRSWRPFNRPGHWNMPCPTRVGMLGGWAKKPLAPSRLTRDEQITHISLWCLWSSPVIIGCPIDKLDEWTLSLLTNDELLDLDQDALGIQAVDKAVVCGRVLVKPLECGDVAVGFVNISDDGPKDLSATWEMLGISGRWAARDLWAHRDLGVFDGSFTAKDVPRHGCMVIRLRRE